MAKHQIKYDSNDGESFIAFLRPVAGEVDSFNSFWLKTLWAIDLNQCTGHICS